MKPRWLLLIGVSALFVHAAVTHGQNPAQPTFDTLFRGGLTALEARRLDEAALAMEVTFPDGW